MPRAVCTESTRCLSFRKTSSSSKEGLRKFVRDWQFQPTEGSSNFTGKLPSACQNWRVFLALNRTHWSTLNMRGDVSAGHVPTTGTLASSLEFERSRRSHKDLQG